MSPMPKRIQQTYLNGGLEGFSWLSRCSPLPMGDPGFIGVVDDKLKDEFAFRPFRAVVVQLGLDG